VAINQTGLLEANARRTREAGPAAADLSRQALDAGRELPEPIRQALDLRANHPRTSWATLAERVGVTKDTLVGRYRRGLTIARIQVPARTERETSWHQPAGQAAARQDGERIVSRGSSRRSLAIDERDKVIVSVARSDPGRTTRELADCCGVSYQIAWNALRRAKVRARAGHRGRRRRPPG
jgi:WhiA C-terminal HTH domain